MDSRFSGKQAGLQDRGSGPGGGLVEAGVGVVGVVAVRC